MARKRKRWLIVIAVVVIAAAAVAYAARTQGNGNGKEEKGPEIPTLAVSIDDVQVVVREVGTVEPEVKVEVKSNLSGKVVDLPIRAGDVVKKGQLIARIEPDVNQAQDLLAVRNQDESAVINLEDARQDYEAKRKLFENGLISVEVNREAETRYRQAQQALDEARDRIGLVEASGIPIGDNPRQVVNIFSPMDGVGPEDLNIDALLRRAADPEVREVILATNPSVDGEATALYLKRALEPAGVRVTRIARGIPMGGDLEYADAITLGRALEGRSPL